MAFSYVHIRYFICYVYHICLQDTIQSTQSVCLLCQPMLLPMPLQPLLLTTRSGFRGITPSESMRFLSQRLKKIDLGRGKGLFFPNWANQSRGVGVDAH